MLTCRPDATQTWCASHYSDVLLKEGDARHAEYSQKASKFYDQALQLLQDRTYPLHTRISAILDLRLGQIERQGASAAYFLLACGDYFIQEECGARPRLNLTTLAGSECVFFRSFAYLDVIRTICVKGRKTVFDLRSGDAPEDGTAPGPLCPPREVLLKPDEGAVEPVMGDALSVHLGLPVGLLLCFASISNLLVDSADLGGAELDAQAAAILRRIRAWRPPPSEHDVTDSALHISDLATQEIWRHACLIYFHSTLQKLGPLATPLRASLKQVLQLASSLLPADHGQHPSVFTARARAPAWFLAATVAVTAEEREVCREHLEECGDGKVWRDNQDVVERLWDKVDRTGAGVDWREECEKEGWAVAFM